MLANFNFGVTRDYVCNTVSFTSLTFLAQVSDQEITVRGIYPFIVIIDNALFLKIVAFVEALRHLIAGLHMEIDVLDILVLLCQRHDVIKKLRG